MAFSVTASNFRVAVVIPVQERVDNSFWDLYLNALTVAAQQLGAELEITFSKNNNRIAYFKAIESVVFQPNKPNYLIAVFFNSTSYDLLSLIKEKQMYYLSTTGSIPRRLNPKIDTPREKNNYWLGHLFPNDFHAGKNLAETLITQANNQGHKKVNMIAINGAREMSITYERYQGLLAAVNNKNKVELKQHIYSDWNKKTAKKLTLDLLKRHPETNAIWAANDEIAAGAIVAIEEYNSPPKIIVGGIDLSSIGINTYKKNKTVTSLGGHFIEGGLALTLLYDHFHGVDFEKYLGTRLEINMSALTSDNITFVNELVIERKWQKLNFKLLSKKEQGHYDNWDENYLTIIKNIYEK